MTQCQRGIYELCSLLLFTLGVEAQPLITEFFAVGGSDSKWREDWIEIHNPGSDAISLEGWFLTDDFEDLQKWRFSPLKLRAGEFVVLNASGTPSREAHSFSFKLRKEGEFLGLIAPDGKTIVQSFGEQYPHQVAECSYGLGFRDGVPLEDAFFFSDPSPGAPNSNGRKPPLPAVTFSHQSTTFTESFELHLGAEAHNVTLRYTLDGSIPQESTGLVYTNPISISMTTQIRARAFSSTELPSPTHSEAYLKVSDHLRDFSSNLPILVLENFGRGKPVEDRMFYAFLFESKEGRARLSNPPDLVTRGRAKVRGSSSAHFEKYSLAWEAWDEEDKERPISPCGLPSDADWVLGAAYFPDYSLMRNALVYRLARESGHLAPRTRFLELFLNTGGGTLSEESTPNDYFGIYALTEKISRGKARVNVERLNASNQSDLSGGYIFKVDRPDPEDTGIRELSHPNGPLCWVYPKEKRVTKKQRHYLTDYLTEFVQAASNASRTNRRYQELIDVPSWIDEHLFRNVAKEPDAFRWSSYFYKPRGGKLHRGPLWDFDRSQGAEKTHEGSPEGWTSNGRLWNSGWWEPLLWQPSVVEDRGDPEFMQAYVDRYQSLRKTTLSTQHISKTIELMREELREAQARNSTRWPRMNRRRNGSASNWKAEVDRLEDWWEARLAWVDQQFPEPPRFESETAESAYHVTAGQLGGFYTMNGSDPRDLGGEPSADAIPFQAAEVRLPIITERQTAFFHVPTDGRLGRKWTRQTFRHDSWTRLMTGVGFRAKEEVLDGVISANVKNTVQHVNASFYLRMPFQIGISIDKVKQLVLKIRFDDGFVAWLNGVKVASQNAPAEPAWNSTATLMASDLSPPQTFDVSSSIPQLKSGENVLAIQTLNFRKSGTDMLVQPTLEAIVERKDMPVVVQPGVTITARSRKSRLWSAATQMTASE